MALRSNASMSLALRNGHESPSLSSLSSLSSYRSSSSDSELL